MKTIAGANVKIGEYGEASVALNSKAEVVVKVEAKINLLDECEKLAAKTNTKLDDQFVATLKGLVAAANAMDAQDAVEA